MGWLSRGRALAALASAAAVIAAAGGCSRGVPASLRVQAWQQDIAYLAARLPAVRAGGLGPVSRPAWDAAAARLEAAVPRLTDDQVLARMAQLVAMLRDDETVLQFPPGPYFRVYAQQVGGGVYLLGVPAADRALLGARLLAVDGQPAARVMARAGTLFGAEDPQLRRDDEAGALDDGAVLAGLGITAPDGAASDGTVSLTVRTAAGRRETVTVPSAGLAPQSWPLFTEDAQPGLATVPPALYQRDLAQPYWLRVLPAQHAVYLRYSQCVPGTGFGHLAAQALALLAAHPQDRLIVDLRDNGGGDSRPFLSLTSAIRASPRLRAPGRVIGLVSHFTDSSATVDASELHDAGGLLIGQAPADPIDRWGNEKMLRLPRMGTVVVYTTAEINQGGTPYGLPDLTVAPTLAQLLHGEDPVLAAALSYRPPR